MRAPIVPRAPTQRVAQDHLERSLHDMANALSAARSYGEVLLRRTGDAEARSLAESLLKELARVTELTQEVRRGTYNKGDVLQCGSCGYTFVQTRGSGAAPPCRRCKSADVRKWRPLSE